MQQFRPLLLQKVFSTVIKKINVSGYSNLLLYKNENGY